MIGKQIKLCENKDDRGILSAVNHIPFDAKRMFFISNVPIDSVRGNHFSKTSSFLYVVLNGECSVELDNGYDTEIYNLSSGEGLLFEKKIWIKLFGFKENTILCVLSDTEYNSYDYVSNYQTFKKMVGGFLNV